MLTLSREHGVIEGRRGSCGGMTCGPGLCCAINIHAYTGESTQACTDTHQTHSWGCTVVSARLIMFSNEPRSSAVRDGVRESSPPLCFSYFNNPPCVWEFGEEPSLGCWDWGRATDTTQPHRYKNHRHDEVGPVEGNCNGKMKTEKLPQHLRRRERSGDRDQRRHSPHQEAQAPKKKSSLFKATFTSAAVPFLSYKDE